MSPPWMPLYIADYIADTGHLSAAEHGAYLLLIMHYWRQGCLPSDEAHLARIARMKSGEWKRSRETLYAFFSDGWVHRRIDSELKKAGEKSALRAEAGSRGGKAKSEAAKPLKDKESPVAIAAELPEQKPAVALASSSQSETEASSLRSEGVVDPDAALFRRGREVLGRNSGGQIVKLKAVYDGSIDRARAAIEDASTKGQPVEYVARIIANAKSPPSRAGPIDRGNPIDAANNILRRMSLANDQQRYDPPDEPAYGSPALAYSGR